MDHGTRGCRQYVLLLHKEKFMLDRSMIFVVEGNLHYTRGQRMEGRTNGWVVVGVQHCWTEMLTVKSIRASTTEATTTTTMAAEDGSKGRSKHIG